MKTSDVMSRHVVTANPDMTLKEAVQLMVQHGVSGLPVLDETRALVGIFTEGDLLRRAETNTEGRPPGWLASILAPGRGAAHYVRTRAQKVGELMTREVVSIQKDAPLAEAAALMETHRVKRLPVVEQGRLLGIVSRADLLRALLQVQSTSRTSQVPDSELRRRLLGEMAQERWVPRFDVDVSVKNGIVELSGVVSDERERIALRVMAENANGAKAVRDNLICIEPMSGAVIDAPDQRV